MTGEVVYNTGNPVPSSDARDRFDNTRVFDALVNGNEATVIGRTGKVLKAWAGFEADFTAFLLASGYEFLGDYDADGPLTITRPNQVFTKDGEYWRSGPALALPYTTVNNWVVDQPKFVAVGDVILRQALAAATGSTLIGYNGGTAVQTVKDRLGKVVMATDYTFLKAACDANLNVLVPPGVYNVTTLITVRDNQTITFMPGAILQQSATGNAGIFNFPAGVKNVVIQGPGILRGPAFGRTPVPAPSYPQSNGAIRMTGTAVNPIVDVDILGLTIEGWDDYGIFSENCQGFRFNSLRIRDIGRDGMRLYGALDGQTNFNRINNISPGFGGVAPNLNVYGITYTRRADNVATPTVTNPPSQRCEAIGNVISNCRTWKGLDTHGGQDLIFANNVISHCHIAIGIDEGDTIGQTDSPPKRIKALGNHLTRGLGNSGGAGINISSSSAANMGEDCELTDNTVIGFGGVGTGGINAAYQARLKINGGHLIDCVIAGINIPGSVRMTGLRINNPTIKNTLADGATPAIAAVTIQAGDVSGCVDGITLVREGGTMFGFSIPTLTAGFNFNIGGEISIIGTVTEFTTGSISRVSGGARISGAKSYARVGSDGSLSHSYGITGVTKTGTGVYAVGLTWDAVSTQTIHPQVTARSSVARMVGALPTAINTVTVYTFNSSGAAADMEFDLLVHGI